MTNKTKFWLLISGLLIWAAIVLLIAEYSGINIKIGNIDVLRAIAIIPFACVFIGEFFSGRPRFIADYMNELVERDSDRGVLSIHNLGLVMFIVTPIFIYLMFFNE